MEPSVLLILLGIGGGLFAGWLGWLESGEPFNARKFTGTTIRSALTGLVGVLAFQNVTDPSIWDYVMAWLTGMGIDYAGNVASKILKTGD